MTKKIEPRWRATEHAWNLVPRRRNEVRCPRVSEREEHHQEQVVQPPPPRVDDVVEELAAGRDEGLGREVQAEIARVDVDALPVGDA